MKLIKLTNGETLELKVNMLTIKMLKDQGALTIVNKLDKGDEVSFDDQVDVASALFHIILYSNGKKVTQDDALQLIEFGDSDIFFEIINGFKSELEMFQKKMEDHKSLNSMLKK